MRRAKLWLGAGLLASLALAGCGSHDEMAAPGREVSSDTPTEPPTLNGCEATDYEDRSGGDAERVIQIAADGLKFTPPCLQIAAGQAVRFEGSLSSHPLAPGNPDDLAAGSPDNPIRPTSSGASVEFAFPLAGTFPYFCELHAFGAGKGMAGAVHVR